MRQLSERRILILDDDILVALDLEWTVRQAGYGNVVTVATVADAVQHVEAWQPDIAIIDLNVSGEKSFPVADVLDDAGVPFAIVSGHSRDIVPARHAERPFLGKPYDPGMLVRTLRQMVEIDEEREKSSRAGQ